MHFFCSLPSFSIAPTAHPQWIGSTWTTTIVFSWERAKCIESNEHSPKTKTASGNNNGPHIVRVTFAYKRVGDITRMKNGLMALTQEMNLLRGRLWMNHIVYKVVKMRPTQTLSPNLFEAQNSCHFSKRFAAAFRDARIWAKLKTRFCGIESSISTARWCRHTRFLLLSWRFSRLPKGLISVLHSLHLHLISMPR